MLHFSGTVSILEKKRFDIFFTEHCTTAIALTRSQLKARMRELIVNGKTAKLSQQVKHGDVYSIIIADEPPSDIMPETIPLDIIYENDDVWVINKPQGMVTHPAHGNWSGTLANALLGRMKLDTDIPARAGIVHRLDKETSGLIIAAKNLKAQEALALQFRQRTTEKFYIALVYGRPEKPEGIIDTWIARDANHRQRFSVSSPGTGKHAISEYKVLCVLEQEQKKVSVMLVKIKTGRTHQIRVHMKHLGTPIIGDPVYGAKLKEIVPVALMLHAYYLKIQLPHATSSNEFTAPLPERITSYLNKYNYILSESQLLKEIKNWKLTLQS